MTKQKKKQFKPIRERNELFAQVHAKPGQWEDETGKERYRTHVWTRNSPKDLELLINKLRKDYDEMEDVYFCVIKDNHQKEIWRYPEKESYKK